MTARAISRNIGRQAPARPSCAAHASRKIVLVAREHGGEIAGLLAQWHAARYSARTPPGDALQASDKDAPLRTSSSTRSRTLASVGHVGPVGRQSSASGTVRPRATSAMNSWLKKRELLRTTRRARRPRPAPLPHLLNEKSAAESSRAAPLRSGDAFAGQSCAVLGKRYVGVMRHDFATAYALGCRKTIARKPERSECSHAGRSLSWAMERTPQ